MRLFWVTIAGMIFIAASLHGLYPDLAGPKRFSLKFRDAQSGADITQGVQAFVGQMPDRTRTKPELGALHPLRPEADTGLYTMLPDRSANV